MLLNRVSRMQKNISLTVDLSEEWDLDNR